MAERAAAFEPEYRFTVMVHVPGDDENLLYRFSVSAGYFDVVRLVHQLPARLFPGVVINWNDGHRDRWQTARTITIHWDGRTTMELADV